MQLRTITLDDTAHTIIGVMPAGFSDPWGNAALWRPIPMNGPEIQNRGSRYWSAFARLREGVTLEQANAELTALAARLEQAHPENYKGWTLRGVDLQGLVIGNYRTGLFVVAGAGRLLLLHRRTVR